MATAVSNTEIQIIITLSMLDLLELEAVLLSTWVTALLFGPDVFVLIDPEPVPDPVVPPDPLAWHWRSTRAVPEGQALSEMHWPL